MEFSTQRELLEYLGKCPDDRSLVQRMIIRGEVFKENGMYYLVNKDEKIKELEILVAKLRSEIATMKESDWDLEFYKVNSEYWEGLNNRKKEIINNILNDIYLDSKKKGSVENTDDFFTRMSEKYGYNPKED